MSDTWDVERKEGKEFEAGEVPPDGAIPARVCAMLDIGTHDARDMKGNAYERRCLLLGFELGEQDSKGQPFFMSKLITLSMDTKSTLYAYVKSLHGEVQIGEKLQPAWIANKPCLLQISHDTKTKKGKERTYANIDSVGKPPRGTVTPPGECVVWRVQDKAPLPNLKHLPPVWHETTGKMLTASEWAAQAKESRGPQAPSQAADRRISAADHPHARQPVGAGAMTQAEADSGEDIPF